MNHAATVKMIWETMTPAEQKTLMDRMMTTQRPLVRMAIKAAEDWDGDLD